MPEPIDANRGFINHKTRHGVEVFMYKDDPGIYLSASGAMVSEALAKDAGFPVVPLKKKGEMKRVLAEAHAEIEQRFQAATEKVLKTSKDYVIVSLGEKRYVIRDSNGTQIHDNPFSHRDAMRLFEKLVPIAEAKAAQEAAEGPAPVDPPLTGEASIEEAVAATKTAAGAA